MTRGYGQYCPLALAAELIGQRWTLLVISRVVDGCSRFNEIHRGVPQMSPSLLSKRLSELEDTGILTSRSLVGSKGREYLPTEAGRALQPIIDELAVWGQHWARDMTPENLDPAFLVWSMHLRMNAAAMPAGRTVLEFEFTGAPKNCRRFWLVCDEGSLEMCLKDPGFDIDLTVNSDLRIFIEAWRGFRDLRAEIKTGRVSVHGPRELVRQFPDWLLLSSLASHKRLRPGREQRLAAAL